MLTVFVLLLFVTRVSVIFTTQSLGVVTLDYLIFNKTISKFKFAFVKFDNQKLPKSPTGSALKLAEEFDKLASEVLSYNSDILAAQIKFDWGSQETKIMASRFQISDNLGLPELILFAVNQKASKTSQSLKANETRYGGQVSMQDMKNFLKGKTGLYLGLKGCLEEFDEMAGTFYRNPEGNDRQKVIRETQRLIQELETKNVDKNHLQSARIYLRIMTSAGTDLGKYIMKDEERIEKLLESKDVSEKSKHRLKIRLNILKSFS